MWAPQYELLRTLQDQFDFPFPGCEAVKGHGQHVCGSEFTPVSNSGGSCRVCVRLRPAIAGLAEALASFSSLLADFFLLATWASRIRSQC